MKILFIILLSSTCVIAQDIPATSNGELKFYVDRSSFKGSDGKTYLEFYLMIHADQLNFTGTENKNALFGVSSVIKDSGDNLIAEKEWFTDALLNRDSINLKELVVYDQWAELLSPGFYNVSVSVTETENKTTGQTNFDVNVPSFDEHNFSVSNIEFISRISENIQDSHFEKHGRLIIPNPWRRYGILIPKLSFYYEIYNIDNSSEDKSLLINYSIVNNDNVEVKKLSDIKAKKSGNDISIIHAIDLAGLKSGIYTLIVGISDSESGNSCEVSRSFEIIQADYLSNYAVLTKEEEEIHNKLMEYFASPGEYKIYESLSSQGKTNFLINFWKEKDTSPDTPENEFLRDIMQKYLYANKNFGWGNKEGYKTDKGRILIKYGMPDEIETYSSEASTAPYEIWAYTEDKKFIFVFGDINSNGNFVLLHSTKEGEVSNYSWKDYLRIF